MDTSLWSVDPQAPSPLYRQIAAQVRRFVAAGHLHPGERLPSVRTLAARHGLNPMTVSRAYATLVEEGVLERRRGAGVHVATRHTRAGLPADARMRLLEDRLQDVIREANDLGLAAGPVCERLHALFLAPTTDAPPKARRRQRRAPS